MKLFKRIGAVMLSVILALSFVACKPDANSGVAATVGGIDLMEADVTARIDLFRVDSTTGEILDDVAWAKMLQAAGHTPESLRTFTIERQFAVPILMLQEAQEAGIAVDTEAIDAQITSQRESFGDDTEGWEKYLKQIGYANEFFYRQWLEVQSIYDPLLKAKVPEATPSQQEIEDYVTANAAVYAGKRSSAIYFALTGENTLDDLRPKAEEVLAKINEGEDFASLATEYTDDTTAKEKAGDMGWSIFASVPQQYTEALNGLAVGETSGLVDTDYGIYIIKATDEFATDEDGTVTFASVPEDIVTMLSDGLKSSETAAKQQAYVDGLAASDKIVINPMPTGLNYDVDMALADTPDTPDEPATPDDNGTNGDNGTEQPPATNTGELGITDTLVGDGAEAKVGDTVSVHYIGYHEDGTVFQSSYDAGTPIQFTLGAGSVIPGWEQGIVGMHVGGKRHLDIPADLAYGSTGKGDIQPGENISFDVELVSIDK